MSFWLEFLLFQETIDPTTITEAERLTYFTKKVIKEKIVVKKSVDTGFNAKNILKRGKKSKSVKK